MSSRARAISFSLLLSTLIFVVTLSVASGALSLFHGRMGTIKRVQKIVALGLGGAQVNQFLECNGTQNNVTNLRWRKNNTQPRLPILSTSSGLRLDLRTATIPDEGLYVCTDIITGDSVSINAFGAIAAINSARAVVYVNTGSSALLKVYFSTTLITLPHAIVWVDPLQQGITSSYRHTLLDSNTALKITNTRFEDNGVYSITFIHHLGGITLLSFSTVITLNVQDKLSLFYFKNGEIKRVKKIVALGVSGRQNTQFLNCNGTQNNVTNLRWRKNNAQPRLPIYFTIYGLRLDLTTANTGDEGIYVCTDIVTGDSVSINVSGALAAINPARAVVYVNKGSSALLKVYFSTTLITLPHTIVWEDPLQQTFPSSSSRHTLLDSNTALRITNTRFEDNGVYSITFRHHSRGRISFMASTVIILNVQVFPTVVSNPMDMSILEFEEITLTCIFSAYPKPVISWQKKGNRLPITNRTNTDISESYDEKTRIYTVTSSFTITTVLLEDAGRYRCSANGSTIIVKTKYAELQVIAVLQITATVNSKFTPIPESSVLSISKNSTVSISCKGSGVLMWSSTSGIVIPLVALTNSINIYQRRDMSSFNQILVIENFNSDSQGEYTCKSNTSQNTTSILLLSSLTVYISSPIIYTSLGVDTNITATFVGSGTITWMFNGQTINSTMNSQYTTVNTSTSQILLVHNVSIDVLGTYTVMISSGGNTEMDSAQLINPDPPTALVIPAVVTVREGEDVQFNCTANGTITAQRWTKNGVVLTTTELLALPSVTTSSAGNYVCEINGQYGGISRSNATLHVNFPPTIEVQDLLTMKASTKIFNITREHGDPGVLFSCHSEGFPKPTITWSRAGGLPTGITSRKLNSEKMLEWNRPMRQMDSGVYICTTSNNIGINMTAINLLVKALAIYISSPIVYTLLGVDVNITASFVGSGTITWMVNGQTINSTINSHYTTMTTPTSQTLLVHNVSSDELGNYTVMISSVGDTAMDTVQLIYSDIPTSIVTPAVVIVNEGETVQFNCTAGGTLVTQRWTRNGNLLTTAEQLVLPSVTISSAGSYVCEVVGQHGRMVRSTATLHVNFRPTVEVQELTTMKTKTSSKLLNITINQGDPKLVFSCHSKGFPKPTIIWFKAGGLPTEVTSRRLNFEKVLEWNRAMRYRDSGIYICKASNKIGTNEIAINLLVEVAPFVSSIMAISPVQATSTSSFSVPIGHTGGILDCVGFAYPPPLIEWITPRGVILPPTTGKHPSVSGKLVLTNFGKKDIGNYSCIVRALDGSGRSFEDTISLTLSNPLSRSDCIVHSVNHILNFVCLMPTVIVSQPYIL